MPTDTLANSFAAAWNDHDMPRLAELFEADARFVNVVGMFWKNREEIEQAHRATHQTIFRNSKLAILKTDSQPLGGNFVASHSHWRLTGQSRPDGNADEPREGILLFVARKSGQDWKIAVAQNTDIAPDMLAPGAHK